MNPWAAYKPEPPQSGVAAGPFGAKRFPVQRRRRTSRGRCALEAGPPRAFSPQQHRPARPSEARPRGFPGRASPRPSPIQGRRPDPGGRGLLAERPAARRRRRRRRRKGRRGPRPAAGWPAAAGAHFGAGWGDVTAATRAAPGTGAGAAGRPGSGHLAAPGGCGGRGGGGPPGAPPARSLWSERLSGTRERIRGVDVGAPAVRPPPPRASLGFLFCKGGKQTPTAHRKPVACGDPQNRTAGICAGWSRTVLPRPGKGPPGSSAFPTAPDHRAPPSPRGSPSVPSGDSEGGRSVRERF